MALQKDKKKSLGIRGNNLLQGEAVRGTVFRGLSSLRKYTITKLFQ